MRLIKPSFKILEQPAGEVGIYKQIEKVGRVCYKSENKITEDSYKKFVEMLKNKQHGAMLEHGTVYLKIIGDRSDAFGSLQSETAHLLIQRNENPVIEFYQNNKYSEVVETEYRSKETTFITTNYRVIVENNRFEDLQYLCEPTQYHKKRITVKFTCDRGVSHEFVRHRVFSFAQESTRYCNYSKDKFDNEITFIIPSWVDTSKFYKYSIIIKDDEGELISEYYFHLTGKEEPHFKPWEITPESNFKASLEVSEQLYLALINQGWKPEQARQVLPNALKTELVMTGFVSDWKHFFDLRDDKDHAHPDAYALAHPLHEEFIKRGYL